ncbi:MAG TPA: hypothetical protein VIU61_18120 [Kofleriaceae bacterium]
MDRFERHREVATALAALSDRELQRIVDAAPLSGTSIGGSSMVLDIADTPVFAKRVPLTDLERRHARSTANLFDLPTVYQYRVGSSGFAVWRELAAHEMTTVWEIAERCDGFPLLHHWRVLEGSPAPAFDLEPAVAYWDGSPAVRSRLEAITRATASVVLFLEYVPKNLREWLGAQAALGEVAVEKACAMVERESRRVLSVMRAHDFLHLDPHFANILTDGERLYFSDFGLATCREFTLSEPERTFFECHRSYDTCVVITELVNWLVTLPEIPARGAAFVERHAQTAPVLNDFYRRLQFESKSTPYPIDQLGRASW